MSTRILARQAVKEQITLAAIRLFQANGYELTTIEDISSEVGMSTRTFFRYFQSKEDALMGPTKLFRQNFLESFEKNLATLGLWEALEHSLVESIAGCTEFKSGPSLDEIQAIIVSTPTLLARQLEIGEQLQAEATAAYLSCVKDDNTLSWRTTNAIIRAGFSCLRTIQCSPSDGVLKNELHQLMQDLRPASL